MLSLSLLPRQSESELRSLCESGSGTKLTSRPGLTMSVHWVRADSPPIALDFHLSTPKQTSQQVRHQSGLSLTDRLIDNPQESIEAGAIVRIAGSDAKKPTVATAE